MEVKLLKAPEKEKAVDLTKETAIENAVNRLTEGSNSKSSYRRDSDAVKVLEKYNLVEQNTELLKNAILQTWPAHLPYGFELTDVGCEALRALSECDSLRSNNLVRSIASENRSMHAAPVIKIIDLMQERLFVARSAKVEDTFAVDIITGAVDHRMLQVREHAFCVAHDLIERNIEAKVMKQLLIDGFSLELPKGCEMPMRSAVTAARKYAALGLAIEPLQSAISKVYSPLSEAAKNQIMEIIVEKYK